METERPRRVLSVGEQYAWMKQIVPRFRATQRSVRHIAWEGTVEPSAMSAVYTVRIGYRAGDVPKVWVLDSALVRRADGAPIPHMYGGETLCLYYPRTGDWTPDQRIATTIVPWTSLWLAHYEAWYATGEWLGGGIHPEPQVPRRTRCNCP